MKFAAVQKCAMALPDSDRAALAAILVDEDDGVAEARRRAKELAEDPSLGCSWTEIKRALGR